VAYSRPVLRWLHIASLVWGILIETFPWVCSLTFLENWLERRAGMEPYHGGFLLHYVDRFVYPECFRQTADDGGAGHLHSESRFLRCEMVDGQNSNSISAT
jgi:hypothetical protein